MFCSRRNVNMASEVDFISMSRNGHLIGFCHTLPKLNKTFKGNNFYLKAMRTYLCDPKTKTKYSCAVLLAHVAW